MLHWGAKMQIIQVQLRLNMYKNVYFLKMIKKKKEKRRKT